MSSPDKVKYIYAIGDIHGYLDALETMQKNIKQDLAQHGIDPNKDEVVLVYLGDYIDRGPFSRDVIDNLIKEQKTKDGIRRVFVVGNHDLCLLDFAEGNISPSTLKWFKYGGLETLKSYGIAQDIDDHEAIRPAQVESLQKEFAKALPKAHKKFIQSLPYYHAEDDYLFVHAGVDPDKSLDEQSQEDLVFIREPFLSWQGQWEKQVVHGHTITQEPVVQTHRIGIDVGVYENARLGCVVLSDEKPRFLYAPTALKQYDDPKP